MFELGLLNCLARSGMFEDYQLAARVQKQARLAVSVQDRQGRHKVSVHKQVSPVYGRLEICQIAGLEEARVLQPEPPPSRRIEVIGASVSNGFGNKGHHGGLMGAPTTQSMPAPEESDPSQAFGPTLGRLLQADTRIIAYEGSGILGAALPHVPRTVELWRQATAGQDHPRHDPSSWIPEVVISQAGANDFAADIPDRQAFARAYVDLLKEVRRGYPGAWIIILLMPKSIQWVDHPCQDMMYTAYAIGMHSVVTEAHRQGLNNLELLPIIAHEQIQHLGSNSHPNVDTHRMMADELVKIISQQLRWAR
ncbi:hypothetical protein WJX74_004178 [Apatococcus lobatus]|uniref:SGNH hydrolase-type esterase domain-containing protein n=1 Tax=Apatococcus lobatus TaxID=904363 RepID=A0AAW1RSD0_9CHLO